MRVRALLVLLVLALAGCGGDDETTSTTTSGPPPATLTADDFAEQANAICAATDRELEPALSIQAQVDAIRGLPAPHEIAEELNALLDEAEAILAELEADPSRLQDDPFADVDERAEELGLSDCAD